MRFTQAGAVAAVLSVSSAFLLPPTISQADTDIISTLPFEDATTIDTRVMEINCPGCDALPTAGKMYRPNTQTMLKLNFSIAHEDRDQLLMNGIPIYPIEPVSAMLREPLTAPLLALTNDNTWEHTWDPTLGYSIMVHHPVPSSSQDQMDLVAIRLEIVEVGDKFLGGLSSIDIKLLETPSGKLMIGDAQTAQAKSEVSKPTDDDHECSTILCKWRAIIADKVSSLKKGCGSKARPSATKGSSEHKSTEHKKKPHHGHHGRPGPHRPFRHHHRHGGFARIFKGLVLHVFIPVLIGIMVGITASLVGMVAGHIVIFVWRTVFRRGQRQQYSQLKQQEEDAEAKAPLSPQGPPPEYEEAVVEKTEE